MSLGSSSASECRNLRIVLRLRDAALRRTSKDISSARKFFKGEVSANVSVLASTSAVPLPSLIQSVSNILTITVLNSECICVALEWFGNTAAAISLGKVAIEDVKALALRLRNNLARDNCFYESDVA